MKPGPIFLGILFAIGVGGPASGQTPPSAPARTFKSSDWVGGTYFNGQQFTGCYVGRSYSDGTKIEFQLTPRLELWIGASKTAWNFDPSKEFELTFEIDGGYRKAFKGQTSAKNRSTLWFNVGNDPDMRRALAGNGTMTWVDPKGLKFPFPLPNSDNAMRKLIACTALYGVE